MSLRALYIKAFSASFSAKIFTSFGAIAMIWLLNQLAGKDAFGLIMLSYALNYILATALASLFQSIIVYHVSREPNKHMDKLTTCLSLSVLIGILFASLEGSAAQALANLMNKPGAAFWFQTLAWMIPAFAANSILSSWYRARQDIQTMVIFFEIFPMALRLLLIGGIILLSGAPSLVSAVYIASYAIPFAILVMKSELSPALSFSTLSRWDISYGAQSMLAQLLNKSIRNIVIFALGFFVSAGAIAEFTLAMRFGQFLQMPKLIIAQLQIPRMGAYLKEQNQRALKTEFAFMRDLSLSATIFGCITFLIAFPFIIGWFGEYEATYGLLLLLAAASIIRAGFGAVGGYLNIAGYAGCALANNIATLIISIVALLLLTPQYGTAGAAASLIIGAAVSMSFMAVIAYKKDKFITQSPSALISIVLSIFALILNSLGILPTLWASLILTLALCLPIYAIFTLWKHTKQKT